MVWKIHKEIDTDDIYLKARQHVLSEEKFETNDFEFSKFICVPDHHFFPQSMSSTYYCEGCTAEARDGSVVKKGLSTGSSHQHKWVKATSTNLSALLILLFFLQILMRKKKSGTSREER